MRLHLYLSPNEQPVPFDYQHYLAGAFHKWLVANDLHDQLSLYSLSWLYEGRARGGALEFSRRSVVPERPRRIAHRANSQQRAPRPGGLPRDALRVC